MFYFKNSILREIQSSISCQWPLEQTELYFQSGTICPALNRMNGHMAGFSHGRKAKNFFCASVTFSLILAKIILITACAFSDWILISGKVELKCVERGLLRMLKYFLLKGLSKSIQQYKEHVLGIQYMFHFKTNSNHVILTLERIYF